VAQTIGSCFAMLVKSESLVISGALRSKARAAAKQSTYGSLAGFEFGGTAGKFGIGRDGVDRQLGH